MVQDREKLVRINVSRDTADKALKRRQSSQLAMLTTRLGDNALAIIGAVTSAAGFIGLVTSEQVRKLVGLYPYPLYIFLITTLLALLMSLNYARTVRSQRNRLRN
jgi:hypothetical protein